MMIYDTPKGFDRKKYFEWLEIHKNMALPSDFKSYLVWFLHENDEPGRQKKLDEVYR